MNFNWVDATIVLVILYYVTTGWEEGLVRLGKSLAAFLGALWLAVKYHAGVGGFLADKFGIPALWTRVMGYFLVAIVAEAVLSDVMGWASGKIPQQFEETKTNRTLGAMLSVFKALVIAAFFLLVTLSLPLGGTVKQDIRTSVLGRRLVVLAERYGGSLTTSIDEAAEEAIRFLTVGPTSREKIPITATPKSSQLTVDETSERRMLELVNAERVNVGAKPLTSDPNIVPVARKHSRDMFQRRYFSHINPEGQDAGDRLRAAGVEYSIAGENLAYAADVETAHEGLLNSEGHRRNILDPTFHRVGIGIINAGIYGKMFTQVFAD